MKTKDILELSYQLAELPSAQHRAGLAGLVLLVQELDLQPSFKERYEGAIVECKPDEFGATFTVNLEGLKALFDLTYKAYQEERWTTNKDKKQEYQKDDIREREIEDKNRKKKLVTEYRYLVTIPEGAFLPHWDRSDENSNQGLWIKLWRDMMWNIVKEKDSARTPFKMRIDEANPYTKDAENAWKELQNPDRATQQSGSYYLGAMADTADNIPTKDLIRFKFLLNFSPFVFQVYCPAILNKDGKPEHGSYAIVIPDVANLAKFCRRLPSVLKVDRKNDASGYRPREALIDLPEQGALDMLGLLRERIGQETGNQSIESVILGAEVIHAQKIGNVVKFYSVSYVKPITDQIDRYREIHKHYWCPWFRKQRLLNLLHSPVNDQGDLEEIAPWIGFDAVLSRVPRQWLEDPYFSHDARQLFDHEVNNYPGENTMTSKIRDKAEIVYKVCQSYVLSKLESKYDLTWEKSKGKSEGDYNEKKTKIANEAFLAVRSRTESQAFIDYFVSTLYPFVTKNEFANFAEDLFNKTDEIRALTLLALASQFSGKKKEENKSDTP